MPDRRSGPSVESGTAHKLGDETSSSPHSVDPRADVRRMNVTGTILVDLTIVPENRHRGRVAAALGTAPAGATVEVVVGPLRGTPDAVRLLRDYVEEQHLSIVVKGETRAVQAWVSALRTGELVGMLL